jgi:hypothetical protein
MKSLSTPVFLPLVFAFATPLLLSNATAETYTREQQQDMCQDDAFRLCNDVIPDEGRVAICLKAKRAELSPNCRKLFSSSGRARDPAE